MQVLRARGAELEGEFGFGIVRQLLAPMLADAMLASSSTPRAVKTVMSRARGCGDDSRQERGLAEHRLPLEPDKSPRAVTGAGERRHGAVQRRITLEQLLRLCHRLSRISSESGA